MGLLMVFTGITQFILRAWVMRDGGLPDGGTGRNNAPDIEVCTKSPRDSAAVAVDHNQHDNNR